MPGRTTLKFLLCTLVCVALGALPARADGIVQSLFNGSGNTSGAKPLFLHGGTAADNTPGKTFDFNGNTGSGGHPSVAGFGRASQQQNAAYIKADVARSAAVAATRSAQFRAANKKAEAAARNATAAQRSQMVSQQAEAANAARAATAKAAAAVTPVTGSMSTPAPAAQTPLYITPGQANTGQAPIFGVH